MQSEKVIIVTGGGSGIGRAAALRFARQGDKVLVTGRRPGPIEELIAGHENIAGLVADAASAEDASAPSPRQSISGQSGCVGQQRGRRCNSSAGRYHKRSHHGHLLRQRARPKFACCCCSSSPAGKQGNNRQRLKHLWPQAGGWAGPLRSQQGRIGALDPLLGAGACTTA